LSSQRCRHCATRRRLKRGHGFGFPPTGFTPLRPLGRLWLLTRLLCSIRQPHRSTDAFALSSTSSTFTFTICPALTTVCGSLTKVWTGRRCGPAVLMARRCPRTRRTRDVGDDAFQDHVGLRSASFPRLPEARGGEFGARVAAGLFEFLEDVVMVGMPNCSLAYWTERATSAGCCADHALEVLLDVGEDRLHQRIRFGWTAEASSGSCRP